MAGGRRPTSLLLRRKKGTRNGRPMAYRLKRKEPVSEGIKRLAAEQMEEASSHLASSGNKEESVHEARKNVKKTRGLLRLVEAELGALCREEDKRLRDIGRALSAIRDAAAIVEVFDALLDKHKAAVKKEHVAGIRRGLEQSKREVERSTGVRTGIERAVAGLHAVRRRIDAWPLQADGFAALEEGLAASYRRGRKRLGRVHKTGDARDFHEFRKSAKEHWYHMRLLEGLWPEPIEARTGALKDLESWLGEHHNLEVLRERLQKEPQEGTELVLALAVQEQKDLERNSISLGRRLYEQKPKQFARDLSKLWDVWHEEAKLPPRKQPSGAATKKAQIA
jgi:CHAD domain-containing protein